MTINPESGMVSIWVDGRHYYDIPRHVWESERNETVHFREMLAEAVKVSLVLPNEFHTEEEK